MTMLLALLSALAVQTDPQAMAGGYVATGEDGQCRVILMEPASRPADSRLVPASTSGLAAAEPGCALALAEAGMWTLLHEEGQLVLTGIGGEPLWTGTAGPGGSWQGMDAAGANVLLARR